MAIPFPALRKIEDMEEEGLPLAALLLAAIELLSDTDDFKGRTDEQIYAEIRETAS